MSPPIMDKVSKKCETVKVRADSKEGSASSVVEVKAVLQEKKEPDKVVEKNVIEETVSNVKGKIENLKEIINNEKADKEKVNVLKENTNVDKEKVIEKVAVKPEVEQNGGIGDKAKNEESNGVGDKIKKFERAAEESTTSTLGRQSRPGSGRARGPSGRLGSDSDIPPSNNEIKTTPKWPKTDTVDLKKPEPQKIIKPEFKPLQSNIDVTIRSPSLGAKISDQFPSHGTAFRNVASPNNEHNKEPHKLNDDVNTQNNVKACKFKDKKYSVSKGSSYFTRGSEEIWLVKKKDIEEIEERVLDSFRRAGGNVCLRGESGRPSSDSGQGASFSHTMGRNKRQMYARSESLDPQWAGARAQTLKRQTSVACTCGHDKKPRAKSSCDTSRPRSKSHGDDNSQSHVLDKYETLV